MFNRILSLALLAFAVSLASACVGDGTTEDLPIDEQAVTGKADGVVWRKVYDCDGAVLDVNSNERRQLQLVVKNHGAADYLLSGGTNGITPQFTSSGELIYRGRVQNGVFQPWDFEGMIGVNAVYPGSDAYIGTTIHMDGDNLVATNYFDGSINWIFRGCR